MGVDCKKELAELKDPMNRRKVVGLCSDFAETVDKVMTRTDADAQLLLGLLENTPKRIARILEGSSSSSEDLLLATLLVSRVVWNKVRELGFHKKINQDHN